MKKLTMALALLGTVSAFAGFPDIYLQKTVQPVRNTVLDISGFSRPTVKGVITCNAGVPGGGNPAQSREGVVTLALSPGILSPDVQTKTNGRITTTIPPRASCEPYVKLNAYLTQAEIVETRTDGLMVVDDSRPDRAGVSSDRWTCDRDQCACVAYSTNRAEITVNGVRFLAVTPPTLRSAHRNQCILILTPPKPGVAAGATEPPAPEDEENPTHQ